VLGIAGTDHDSVYGLRRHGEWFSVLRGSYDPLDC
jgi:hypothetical protein